MYEERVEEQRQFQKSEQALQLFTAGLEQLCKFKNELAIEVTSITSVKDSSPTTMVCIGHDSLVRFTGEHILPMSNYDRQIALLLDSIATSVIQVDSFTVADPVACWNINTLSLDDHFLHAAQLFSGLRHLDLSFAGQLDLTEAEVERVLKTFDGAYRLECVSMQTEHPAFMVTQVLHGLLQVKFNKLKIIRFLLAAGWMNITELVYFINGHKETLSLVLVAGALCVSKSAVDTVRHLVGTPRREAFDGALEAVVMENTGFDGIFFHHCLAIAR